MKSFNSTYFGLLAALFFAASAFTNAPADEKINATQWEIDQAHSNLNFKVTHFFTPVNGKFHDYNSDIYFSPDNLEESSINVEVMVGSIDTNNEKRDGHLQSDDFFNAEKYPKMTFTSNKITSEGNNEFIAHGELTIKDVTKEVQLPFTLLGVQDHPMRENTKVAGIKGGLTIDRTDYDVGVGDWAATAVVGDEVTIDFALELNTPSGNS
ncbi:MAG: YceI family protein [Balneolaceae bacterium]|nr:YceI family protein [Balneolaceae bacterium]